MKMTLMATACAIALSVSPASAQHRGGFGSAFGGAALGGVLGGVLGNALTQPQPPPPQVYVAPPPVIYERRVYVAPAPVYIAPAQHISFHPWPGPGFACYDPEPNAVNRTICASQDLSAASLAVAQALYAGIQQTPYNAGALRAEYAVFLQSERSNCAPFGFQQQVDCIAGMLSREHDILAGRLTGVFAEEANRPVALHLELQQRLHAMGLLPGVVDGIYGDGTRRAIATWQSGQGRSPTGVLSDEEVALLIPGYGAASITTASTGGVPTPPPAPVQQAAA